MAEKAVYAAIVLSAGTGSRMHSTIPKQYMDLLGRPVIYYSLKAFQDSAISKIVLVTGKDDIDYCRHEIVEKYGITKVCAIVAGGAERYDSVRNGLLALSEQAEKRPDYVMIHDGARPMLNQEMICRLQNHVESKGSCVLGMPVKDTIRLVDENRFGLETPDRRFLWQIQTPQTFCYSRILDAYRKMHEAKQSGQKLPAITDDAMVAEYFAGERVAMVEGAYENIKITTPEDIKLAALFLKETGKV